MAAPLEAPPAYTVYLDRIKEREDTISERIKNIRDPIDAVNLISRNEGINLKVIWESDYGCPIDGILVCIILLPIVLGVIGNYFFSIWEPTLTEEEFYDQYGKKVVEYPMLPIAYLQQSPKDMSGTRENRNSLAWLCHRWLISTTDVVQELPATYPVEEYTVSGWGTVKALARLYHLFQQVSNQRDGNFWEPSNYPPVEKQIHQESQELQAEALNELKSDKKSLRKLKSVFMRADPRDVHYISQRIPAAKRLWKKINQWVEEYYQRETKLTKGDSLDTFWTSSETFSSDSGEHWKSYKGNVHNWLQKRKVNLRWQLEKKRRRRVIEEAEAAKRAAEEAEKRKAAEEELAAAAKLASTLADGKSEKQASKQKKKLAEQSITLYKKVNKSALRVQGKGMFKPNQGKNSKDTKKSKPTLIQGKPSVTKSKNAGLAAGKSSTTTKAKK
ncbi:hypothetical protein Ocin01_17677 [Orchesella cincta]|uniref:Uncharacterized protein n=1 Tax=Orchesella cincta TaxID=48709 RepID=A0A1D2M7R0_ORCCI|nr:hypothetical protein Ocin01_17677 [Orchesella cincta]